MSRKTVACRTAGEPVAQVLYLQTSLSDMASKFNKVQAGPKLAVQPTKQIQCS